MASFANLRTLVAAAACVLVWGCGGGGGGNGTNSDTTPPTVLSVSPVNNGVDVLTTTEISVEFSETMSQTAAQGAFSISPSATGTFSWNMNTMTFAPAGALTGKTSYTCTVSTAAKDSADNALASQYQWIFTTVPKPTLVGSSNLGNGRGVYVSGNYAYVADQMWGLWIFDISNPAVPSSAGSDLASIAPQTIFVAGNYAYVTNSSGDLGIYDITNKTQSVLVSYTIGWDCHDVYVVGNYAYISSGGLKVADITDPANPTLVGSLATSGHFQNVFIAGSYAYGVDPSTPGGKLQIINISNPASPTLAGSYIPVGDAAKEVYVVGNYAYVTNGNGMLEIVDITDKASPALLGSIDAGGFVNTIRVSGNYAYVFVDSGDKMPIINISNPAAPVLVGSYAIPSNSTTKDVFVSGGYAYIVVQPTDLNNPGLLVVGGI